MAKPVVRASAFSFPLALTAEEKRHKELMDKYRESKKKLAEKKAAADKGDKKLGKRTMEEAEEATNELIKKVQEGKITMKRQNDEKHTFKRLRLSSTAEGGKSVRGGEDGEILDLYEDDLESSPSVQWQERRQDSNQNTQKTIYVKGNDLERDSLRDTFEKYGNIRRINVAERQRHAFIEFNHSAEAEMAVREMNNNIHNGELVHVSLARRKEDGPALRDRFFGAAFDDIAPSNVA